MESMVESKMRCQYEMVVPVEIVFFFKKKEDNRRLHDLEYNTIGIDQGMGLQESHSCE